jgi:hypothetical protein
MWARLPSYREAFSFVPPVLGRVAAGVFTGEGTFHLEPATPLERDYLRQISGNDTVDEQFRSAVFWFTDDTFEEIKRQAQANDEASQANAAWQEFRRRVRHRTETPRSMLEYLLQNEYVTNEEAEILGELYNRMRLARSALTCTGTNIPIFAFWSTGAGPCRTYRLPRKSRSSISIRAASRRVSGI